MRTMVKIHFPVEIGNKVVSDGTLPKMVETFSKEYKPEAAYFFPENGKRTMLFVFDLPDSTHIPSIAERFFRGLNAEIVLTPVMNADDLKTGLSKI